MKIMEDENKNSIDDKIDEQRALTELEIDKTRWAVRRKLAVWSFTFLLCFGIYYSLIGLFIDDLQAKAMAEFNGIVVSIIGALTTVLIGYLSTSYLYDKDNINNKQ